MTLWHLLSEKCLATTLLQAIAENPHQLLRTRVHQHVGTQGIGDKTEGHIVFGISKPDGSPRPRMTKSPRAEAEGGVGYVRLIQHTTQAKTRPGQ